MTQKRKIIMVITKHISIGILIPSFLLFNAFIVPEPYSHPLIHIAIAPAKLMPILENHEFMRELTVLIFGKMTPNYAPIQIIFLIAFWFAIGVVGSLVYSSYHSAKELD